ncbi:MAG: phosphoglycerate mutase [Micavibrio aeruginosavorus]|uniref:Phosphoglycerate mutase n=1 Tax=Micavibrio aeruginosavorus TaxID=349221 RepID=A0A2W5FMP3_9BACT|nr:MAG: phosphoglycerate mutase [Micavibrio aeruginosavorus]
MTTTLLIARHGNTFSPGDTPTRVGGRTDLPLVESGQEQARNLGRYLKDRSLIPDLILTSQLKRTKQMAEIIKTEIGAPIETHPLAIFNEIDYGPDENKKEEDVIARLGREAIEKWDKEAIVPDGWLADPEQITRNWQNFANELETGGTTLVITSNGIARFAPAIAQNPEAAASLKISTGALCHLERNQAEWLIKAWNIKPFVI